MWKNKSNRKGLGLFSVYEVRGLNLDGLIKSAKNRGIDLYNVKKYKNKRMNVTVNFKDGENFFAIARELCYNIKKVRDKGRGYPLYLLFKSFGLILGAIFFCLTQCAFNDLVLDVCYSGSGIVLKTEVQEYLALQGIGKYSRFSKIDLPTLEDGILSDNKNLSFASCKKKGNRLLIELVLSDDSVKTLEGDKYQMLSTDDGIVESVKVYRGTALVKVGDTVKKGDLLVDGIATVKDQTVKINVLAVVTLKVEREFTFVGEKEAEAFAQMLSTEKLHGEEILSIQTERTDNGQEYFYKVTAKIRRVISVG